MRVSVTHTIGDLRADLQTINRTTGRVMAKVVRDNVHAGNRLAKRYAREANPTGSHAYQYPGAFSAETGRSFKGASVSIYSGEYGPLAVGQGMLAHILEDGEGANAPQNNLAKSTDVIGPAFAHDVGRAAGKLFWPNS